MRVALVLDNTGSMADDGKMPALKTATKSLLDPAQGRGRQRRRRLCLDRSVRQGRQCRQEQLQRELARLDRLGRQQRHLQQATRLYGTRTTSRLPNGKHLDADNHSTWNGCVIDRGNSNAPTPATTTPNATAPDDHHHGNALCAEQYNRCPKAAIMPLSYDWTGMTTLVTLDDAERQHQPGHRPSAWLAVAGRGRTVPHARRLRIRTTNTQRSSSS